MSDTLPISRWWYLDLAAEFPELEVYTGHGWGPDQELGMIELGERVMTEEAFWLFTKVYSLEKDRIWAAVSGMTRMVIEYLKRTGKPWTVPPPWWPDTRAWEEGRLP